MLRTSFALTVATFFLLILSFHVHAKSASCIGTYDGEISSDGDLYKGKTSFTKNKSGGIVGEYSISEQKKETKGILKACEEIDKHHLKCVWQDSYGYGDVEFIFNSQFNKFIGMWNAFGDTEKQVWHGAK